MSDTEPGGAAASPAVVTDFHRQSTTAARRTEPRSEPAALEQAVQAWLHDRIANGPIARDENAWAQLQGALPDLIARLAAPQA